MVCGRWHAWWQSRFAEREVVHPKLEGCVKERRADAVTDGGALVVEIQHSPIPASEVVQRCSDYARHGKRVVWVVDGNSGVRVRELLTSGNVLLAFDDFSSWKFASFARAASSGGAPGWVYVDCGDVDGRVYRVAPGKVRGRMIDVRMGRARDEFVAALQAGAPESLWEDDDDELPQGTLYLNQRGAGCGKTYESVQLLTNDPRFAHKTTFVYLTKAHTAKTVILNELVQQMRDGKLEATDDPFNVNAVGKQYRVSFTRRRARGGGAADADEQEEDVVSIVIGTIDSFMYALGDRSAAADALGDYFHALRRSIKDGFRGYDPRDGGVRYAAAYTRLNRRCLVVIDEAQDLDLSYLEAMAVLMRDTYMDVYVIGDKLQSIWSADNVFTRLWKPPQRVEEEQEEGQEEEHEQGCAIPRTRIVASTGDNVVRRFHHPDLMRFVNQCVDFGSHGLPAVSGICSDRVGCGHPHPPEDEPGAQQQQQQHAVHLVDQISSCGGSCGERRERKFVERIVKLMDDEVCRQGLLPRNIMFIFPFVSKNKLAERIEASVNDYWICKFDSRDYQEQVLVRDEYWRDRVGRDEFHRHAVLHKSEQDRPINLDESTHATRMLSIHASKGMGCEVVFLLQLSEDTLKRFSRGEINLVYDSLLHVAITRQKRVLYVGVPEQKDDVRARLTRDPTRAVAEIMLTMPRRTMRIDDVCSFATETDPAWLEKLGRAYILPSAAATAATTGQDRPPGTIEWGHHVIRYHVMRYSLLYEIARLRGNGIQSPQLHVVMTRFATGAVHVLRVPKYYEKLREISDNNNAEPVLPILSFRGRPGSKYERYCNDLERVVRHVQGKLRASLPPKLPELCPIEMCVLVHMLEVQRNGVFTPFSAAELYDILHSVKCAGSDCFDRDHGRRYNCLCHDVVEDGGAPAAAAAAAAAAGVKELRENVVNHYIITAMVGGMFERFVGHVRGALDDASVLTFLVLHPVSFGGNTDAFKLKCDPALPIVATTDRHVILFALRPSFNRLSRDAALLHALVTTFVARNTSPVSKNHARFHGKRVLVCVFTFSGVEEDAGASPVWIDMDGALVEDDAPVRDCIAAAMRHRFRPLNEALWARFDALLRSCKNGRVSPAFNGIQEELDEADKAAVGGAVPQYVKSFFEAAKSKSRDERRCVVTGAHDLHAALDSSLHDWIRHPDAEDDW
jgi:Competence protein CoiA-like family